MTILRNTLLVIKLHCDVIADNLLLVNAEKPYPNQNWPKNPTFQIRQGVWKRTARGSSEVNNDSDNSEGQVNSEYESPRLKRVKELGRGPYCVLHDTEFTVDAKPDRKEVHPDCTGTPTSISAQLLIADRPIARTFMHDIESLFWVPIRRTQDPNSSWSVNEYAKGLIREFSNTDMAALGKSKKLFINDSGDTDCEQEIMKLESPWYEDLALLIQEFGVFLYYYLYVVTTRSEFHERAGDAFEGELQRWNQYLDQPHQKTFDHLFGILEHHKRILEKNYQVDSDLTKL